MSSKKNQPRFISSIISVAFVLFSLGLLVFTVAKSNQLVTELKEKVEVNIFLSDELSQRELDKLIAKVSEAPYTKSQEYISKDEAKKEFSESFELDVLDSNPLPASINVFLRASYANQDSLEVISNRLLENSGITDVFYQKELLNLVNTNVKKIGGILITMLILFSFIALTLIDNAIRLSLFSQRFIIKSMQLVGAKDSFILKPFLGKGVLNGLYSSFISLFFFTLLYYALESYFPIIEWPQDKTLVLVIVLGTFILGMVLSFLATWHSVTKYLNTKIEELY